ncbi:hypothetical protein P0Y35_01705 [Kiritimatiellaeota bacterium B1221]|nr:hypothetical protein [Kiritimatiellaeota bacterium B1221]
MMRILFLSLCACLLAACTTGRAKYQVNVGNGNPQLPVQDVQLRLDGKVQNEFTVIAPNKIAASKSRKGDLPETLTVAWKDVEGKPYEETIRIDVTTRPDFTGMLVLNITEANKLTLTEVPSTAKDYSEMPWNMQEDWEGSVSLPGME